MGWTFRRSREIAPGLRLNISKSSLGLMPRPDCDQIAAAGALYRGCG